MTRRSWDVARARGVREGLEMMRMMGRRAFLGMAGAAVLPGLWNGQARANAGSGTVGAVIDFLEAERKAGSFPGAAVVASRGGKVFLEHYTGTYHNMLGEDREYRPEAMCVFFSYSKGISATVVMTAHQEGLIDIDGPVAKELPEFAAHGKEKVTFRQVLSHAAGIPSAPTPFRPMRDDAEWDAAIAAVCDAKLEFEPGSRTAYHGAAMMIPAEAIRRKLGRRSWDSICRERLFDPIGAPSLRFEVPEEQGNVVIAPKDAKGADGGQVVTPGHPAGGCFGTLRDALRVLELHLAKGVIGDRTVLRPEAFEAMHRVQFAKAIEEAVARGEQPRYDAWGLGWLLRGSGPAQGASWFGFRDQEEPRVFGHAGIDTVIGVANPATNVALMFHTTRSPKSSEETVRLRNEVTNRVLAIS